MQPELPVLLNDGVDRRLIDHLRRVLTRVGVWSLDGPGQLQLELLRELAEPPTSNHLHQIRLLAAAVDENVPRRLVTEAPLESDDIARIVNGLAWARGWNHETARRIVNAWISALEVVVNEPEG